MSKCQIVEVEVHDGVAGWIHGMGTIIRRLVVPVEGMPGGAVHITPANKVVHVGPYDIRQNQEKRRIICEVEVPDWLVGYAIELAWNQAKMDSHLSDIVTLLINPQLPT